MCMCICVRARACGVVAVQVQHAGTSATLGRVCCSPEGMHGAGVMQLGSVVLTWGRLQRLRPCSSACAEMQATKAAVCPRGEGVVVPMQQRA
jgi:hypothetical protein